MKNTLVTIPPSAELLREFAAWTALRWSDAKLGGIDQPLASEVVMLMGLGGETGEIIEELMTAECQFSNPTTSLVKELGDAMHYWARVGDHFRFDLVDLYGRDDLLGFPSAQTSAFAMVAASGQVLEAGKKYIRDGELNREKLQAGLVSFARHWRELCSSMGVDVEAVLLANREKVDGRHARGVLRGSGNDR